MILSAIRPPLFRPLASRLPVLPWNLRHSFEFRNTPQSRALTASALHRVHEADEPSPGKDTINNNKRKLKGASSDDSNFLLVKLGEVIAFIDRRTSCHLKLRKTTIQAEEEYAILTMTAADPQEGLPSVKVMRERVRPRVDERIEEELPALQRDILDLLGMYPMELKELRELTAMQALRYNGMTVSSAQMYIRLWREVKALEKQQKRE